MKLFRKILFWCHLIVGVSAVVVVVIMSATGVLLTYQKQMTAWADRRAVNTLPPQAGAPRLSVDELIARASTAANANATSVTIRSRSDAPAEIAFGRDRRELVNVYTGALLGEGSKGMRAFFRWVTAWHRTLGATGENRTLARQITGAANLGFLFLVVSGFYLWWPRNWTFATFRNVLMFRRRLSGKARDFNWHNVIGFWSAVPLFVVVLSGVVISYRWAGDLVYRSVGEQPPVQSPPTPAAPQKQNASAQTAVAPARENTSTESRERLDRTSNDQTSKSRDTATLATIATPVAYVTTSELFARAQQREPQWTTISATLPNGGAKTVTLSLDRGMGGQPQLRSQLVLDRVTANEVRFEPFESQTPGRRLRTIMRFAHTGEVLGVFGQTVAGLVSLGAVLLGWTGLALSFRRLRAWLKRKSAEQAETETLTGPDRVRTGADQGTEALSAL